MQDLMPPINTQDSIFHDGDPTTGQLGTIVTALWLNNVQAATRDVQAEIKNVLAKAGMTPDPKKNNQLADAISQIVSSGNYASTAYVDNGLNKKIDKANISGVKGNDNDKVPSLNLFTTETGKLATKAELANYATNATVNSKFEAVNTAANNANNNANGRVPNTRRVNNKPLSADITLTAGDVGAYTKAEVDSRSVNLDAIYPIGIVAWFAQNKNPNTLFPNTKWQYLGENKTIRLANSNGSNVLTTGGADSIQLTEAQLPAHNHSFSATTSSFDYGTKSTNTTGAHTHGVNGEDSGSGGSNFGRGNGNTRTINGMHSAGNHAHTVAIGAHSHTVSGTTESKGSSSAINVTNAYIMLMGWYRVS